MAHWAVVISDERHEAERLFHHDTLELTGLEGDRPAPAIRCWCSPGARTPPWSRWDWSGPGPPSTTRTTRSPATTSHLS
ncbi:hypothetical protein Prum_047600 [Phytohabitans rumicis]|uniref:Uncharacterized protein n=1 Tax=Phytohabitans rumicis TaxID=1076125 RepID=A0A6V8L808_9ACTN|nr:hypothetical protein Prum_047600 [Phytohabitans rumicis]